MGAEIVKKLFSGRKRDCIFPSVFVMCAHPSNKDVAEAIV